MTDNDTLADYNLKDFGKSMSAQVACYRYPIGINSEPVGFCCDMMCLECVNNRSFRGNFEDATTLIDLLPEIFPEIFKNNRSSISTNKLQEFVN
jgi:hypothetical protein